MGILNKGLVLSLCFLLAMTPAMAAPGSSVGAARDPGASGVDPALMGYGASTPLPGLDRDALSGPIAPKQPTGAGDESSGLGRGSEYLSGYYRGAVLIPVDVWGAVGKPGVHHVPIQTDLITLITLAGGPSANAKLHEVVIKRRGKTNQEIIEVDLEELMEGSGGEAPRLQAEDVVMIPAKRPFLDGDFLQTVGLISSALGVAVSVIFISTQLNKE